MRAPNHVLQQAGDARELLRQVRRGVRSRAHHFQAKLQPVALRPGRERNFFSPRQRTQERARSIRKRIELD